MEVEVKVNFRDITITVKNKNAGSKKHFTCDWEGFAIDVEKSDGVWECYVKDDTDMYICDSYLEEGLKLSEAVQWCFDMIDNFLNNIEEETKLWMQMLRLSRKYRKNIVCPVCESKKIFKFRLDSDWASGSGDYYTVNPDENYTEEELKYDSFDRPDIEVYHCGDCGNIFE